MYESVEFRDERGDDGGGGRKGCVERYRVKVRWERGESQGGWVEVERRVK